MASPGKKTRLIAQRSLIKEYEPRRKIYWVLGFIDSYIFITLAFMQHSIFGPVTLDSYFDRIFYINLERDILRNEHMLAQFKKSGITNFERINAIELTELPGKEKYRNFIKHDLRYQIGQLACRASHVKCITLAKERNYKNVLILEDDAVFLQDPNVLLAQNHTTISDWDMLYWGGLIEPHFRGQVVCAHAYGVKNTLYDDILYMADASGMEIDNFYAKIIQHMSFNHNHTGRYNIRGMAPFNQVIQNKAFQSNIQLK